MGSSASDMRLAAEGLTKELLLPTCRPGYCLESRQASPSGPAGPVGVGQWAAAEAQGGGPPLAESRVSARS